MLYQAEFFIQKHSKKNIIFAPINKTSGEKMDVPIFCFEC